MVEHRRGHRLRRLGRLVRSSDAADREPVLQRRRRQDQWPRGGQQPRPAGPPARPTARGRCTNGPQRGPPPPATPLNGTFAPAQWGRCGYGPRLPLLVVSRFAKRNYVDHTLTDQTSVLRFIEDNWLAGQRIPPNGSLCTSPTPP